MFINLFVLIHFPNLVLIKLTVRTLLAKETFENYTFQHNYEFLTKLNKDEVGVTRQIFVTEGLRLARFYSLQVTAC